jgi:DNA-directed RNA polymerase specialized sigma24 family protein
MTDNQILEGLKSDDEKLRNQAGKVLKKQTFTQILIAAENKREIAQELFTESYLALMTQLQKKDWQLKNSLVAWFCQTARFIFWKMRRNSRKIAWVAWEKIENSELPPNDLKANPENDLTIDDLDFICRQMAWEDLGEDCKKLLLEKYQYIIDAKKPKSTWRDLMQLFGISENALKKRAFDCREKLQKLFENCQKRFNL